MAALTCRAPTVTAITEWQDRNLVIEFPMPDGRTQESDEIGHRERRRFQYLSQHSWYRRGEWLWKKGLKWSLELKDGLEIDPRRSRDG
jgi:hypothetical protein